MATKREKILVYLKQEETRTALAVLECACYDTLDNIRYHGLKHSALREIRAKIEEILEEEEERDDE